MKHTIFFRISAFMIMLMCCSASVAIAETVTSAGVLKLEEIVICRNVTDRTPIGRGSVFSVNVKQLCCFTKVVGASADTEIVHKWFLNGVLKSSVTLPVRSTSWRTWSSKEITPKDAGDWVVDVMTSDGVSIESVIFFVK